MLPLTDQALRASFINASRREVNDMSLPAGFDAIDWASIEFLGWRDPKFERRAYVVIPLLDSGHAGIVLRHPGSTPRVRAQCSWCQDVTLPNDVILYTAKRAGKAGRNGDTVGVLVCEDFQCPRNARRPPRAFYEGFDADAARQEQVANLQLRVMAFAAEV